MESEIEGLKEENHKLQLKIQSIVSSSKVEIEYHREECDRKEKEVKEQKELNEKIKSEFRIKEKDLQERVQNLSEDLLQSREDCESETSKLEALKRRIVTLEESQFNRSARTEDYDSLKINNDKLQEDVKGTQQMLEKTQSQLCKANQERKELENSLNNLRDENESKDSCISQLQTKIKDIEKDYNEEIMAYQQMLVQQKPQETDDHNQRGNSLFSEVEQRRVKVEEELNRLRTRVLRLTEKNVELQGVIDKGDRNTAIITTHVQRIERGQDELIQELKKLKSESLHHMDSYRDRMSALRDEYKKKLIQYKFGGVEPSNLDELEGIRQERDSLLVQKMSLERELLEHQKELKYTKHQYQESESKSKILKLKIQELQEKLTKLQQTQTNGNINNLDRSMSSSSNSNSLAEESSSDLKLYDSILQEKRKNLNSPMNLNTLTTNKNLISPSKSGNKPLKNSNSKPQELQDCKTQ